MKKESRIPAGLFCLVWLKIQSKQRREIHLFYQKEMKISQEKNAIEVIFYA